MREFFEIEGYWKDSKEMFDNYIVTNFEDVLEDFDPYTDDDIFYYGLDEEDLQEAIKLKENTTHDFVITNYTKIIL